MACLVEPTPQVCEVVRPGQADEVVVVVEAHLQPAAIRYEFGGSAGQVGPHRVSVNCERAPPERPAGMVLKLDRHVVGKCLAEDESQNRTIDSAPQPDRVGQRFMLAIGPSIADAQRPDVLY